MLKGMQGMSAKPTEERDLQNTIDALEKFLQKNQEHQPMAGPNDKLPTAIAKTDVVR